MPSMATTLTEFSDQANSRTFTTAGHTPLLPRLVIQKRKVPQSSSSVAETTISVVHGTSDSEGAPISSKTSFEVKVRQPVNGDSSDLAAALVILRDIIASDEFANAVNTQEYLA